MPPARIPRSLADRPFTRAEAAASGVSVSALRSPVWRPLFRGVWVHVDYPLDADVWVAAARLVLPPDAALIELSATTAYGLDVRAADDVTVQVCCNQRNVVAQPPLEITKATLAPADVITRGDWLVTTPVRTAYDCARRLPLTRAVPVVDALVHTGLTSLGKLAAFVDDHPGARGICRARRVVDLVEPLSESPRESLLRVHLMLGGLPRPVAQYVVRDPLGQFIARLDLAYPDLLLAIEYDGALHWQQRQHDDQRRDALRDLGWTVIVVGAESLRDAERLVADVRRTFGRLERRRESTMRRLEGC